MTFGNMTFGNMTFGTIIYLFMIIIVLFSFTFIFMNMFIDINNYLNPKKGSVLEEFINVRMRTFEDNSFKEIILPNVDDYDLEIAIPVDQKLNATVQGNWGFNQDENGQGFSTGVYRDGYTADGSIFKGISEKRHKYMLDQGPYVIKYEIRKNKSNKHDVRIFINNKQVSFVENEGISSGLIKYIGTNETLLNKNTDSTSEGRRKIDYLKFIPKSNLIKKKV
tara:strand:+ start:53 stop:718 length:666 start_codon:yes stop_codon:yes gene_type:complete